MSSIDATTDYPLHSVYFADTLPSNSGTTRVGPSLIEVRQKRALYPIRPSSFDPALMNTEYTLNGLSARALPWASLL